MLKFVKQISKFVSAFGSVSGSTCGYISVPGEFEDGEIDFRVYCRSPLSNNSFSNLSYIFMNSMRSGRVTTKELCRFTFYLMEEFKDPKRRNIVKTNT